CTGGSNCFVAGTLVQTPEGPQPIEQIRAGDVVISEDEATGAVVLEPVLATFVTEDRDVVDVYLRGAPRPVRATPGHRFFTRDAGWVVTEALLPDEPLVALDGSVVLVDRLEAEGATSTVYNFEVESTHTYFVGDGTPVLVHNPMTPTGKPVT